MNFVFIIPIPEGFNYRNDMVAVIDLKRGK